MQLHTMVTIVVEPSAPHASNVCMLLLINFVRRLLLAGATSCASRRGSSRRAALAPRATGSCATQRLARNLAAVPGVCTDSLAHTQMHKCLLSKPRPCLVCSPLENRPWSQSSCRYPHSPILALVSSALAALLMSHRRCSTISVEAVISPSAGAVQTVIPVKISPSLCRAARG